MFSFEVIHASAAARAGRIVTDHGEVATPVFMPVGTAGSVKGVTPDQLAACGTRMILANTYHLMLRPGASMVAALGGLHRFMAWDKPILTDSGGYQVFSLAHLRRIDDEGVVFRSHIDGREAPLTPAGAVEMQRLLGSDVIMQLDQCPPGSADRAEVAEAVRRSAEWAGLCRQAWLKAGCLAPAGHGQALFGIQQGGTDRDLRAESAGRLVDLDLPGYAIGGLSVGEGHERMLDILEQADRLLPACKPRYLMGVGEPRDIIQAVARGVDMFDCVLPTRNGRNAQAFTWSGRLRLRNAQLAGQSRPIDESCDCYTCRNFSRGALRHLFMAGEMLGPTLATIHNLRFFAQLTAAIREAIRQGDLERKAAQWLAAMDGCSEP